MSDELKLLFVGGAPRSGTTLVQRVIGAHPEIYGGPEFDVIPKIMELRAEMLAKVRNGRISAIVDEAEVDRAIRNMVLSCFEPKAEREGVRILSEKSPANVEQFEQLLELLPTSKCIFVLRDPRDIFSSMKRVHEKARANGRRGPRYTRHAAAGANLISEYWLSGLAAFERYRDRVLPVYYEDLVNRPEEEVRRLSDFIGVAFSARMVRVEESAFEYANPESFENWYSVEQITKEIDKGSIGCHRENLSGDEVSIIENAIPEHALWQRYNLGSRTLPVTARVRKLPVTAFETARRIEKSLRRWVAR